MTYEFINLDTGGRVLKATDQNGKVWYIPEDSSNTMYQAYLKTITK